MFVFARCLVIESDRDGARQAIDVSGRFGQTPMFAALRSCASRLTPTSTTQLNLLPSLSTLFSNQVRHRKAYIKHRWKPRPGRMAGKGNAVWWQPLLPALATERAHMIGGQGGNDRKKNQQRYQQSLWDTAKRIESERRTAIFNTLKRDARMEKVKAVYSQYADFLREYPNGFKPSPSRRQQKILGAQAALEAKAAAAADPPVAPEPDAPGPPPPQ